MLLDKVNVKGSWHKHRRKYETWLLLVGKVNVLLDGKHIVMEVGDESYIRAGIPHQFWAEVPSLINESSSYDTDNDTYRWDNTKREFINNEGNVYFNLYLRQKEANERANKRLNNAIQNR